MALPTAGRLPATDRLVPGRYLFVTHASSRRTLASAYSQWSRSRSGTRWVRSWMARSAASKTAEIRVCWLVALMRLDCSQAGRHLQPSVSDCFLLLDRAGDCYQTVSVRSSANSRSMRANSSQASSRRAITAREATIRLGDATPGTVSMDAVTWFKAMSAP